MAQFRRDPVWSRGCYHCPQAGREKEVNDGAAGADLPPFRVSGPELALRVKRGALILPDALEQLAVPIHDRLGYRCTRYPKTMHLDLMHPGLEVIDEANVAGIAVKFGRSVELAAGHRSIGLALRAPDAVEPERRAIPIVFGDPFLDRLSLAAGHFTEGPPHPTSVAQSSTAATARFIVERYKSC